MPGDRRLPLAQESLRIRKIAALRVVERALLPHMGARLDLKRVPRHIARFGFPEKHDEALALRDAREISLDPTRVRAVPERDSLRNNVRDPLRNNDLILPVRVGVAYSTSSGL